jgi:hypothetical protein
MRFRRHQVDIPAPPVHTDQVRVRLTERITIRRDRPAGAHYRVIDLSIEEARQLVIDLQDALAKYGRQ